MPSPDPTDWDLLEDWFERLTSLTPEQQGRQLEEIRAADPVLARNLQRLLDGRAEAFFDDLQARVAGSMGQATHDSGPVDVLAQGDRINQFEVLGELGRGGMGIVYRARDTVLERDVALKFLPPRIADNAGARERFLREARVVSHVDHPNICTIFDVSKSVAGHFFIVMACYEGQTLRDLMDAGPVEPEFALELFRQIAAGLAVAHQNGVVHRDIKPDNLFVTSGGQIKILDFGVAKALQDDSLTKEGARLGTLNYMSPEQAQGLDADARSDIWSLAAVMYEVLAGRRPFEAPYDQPLLHAILNEPTPALESGQGIEPWLVEIVTRCLEKDPADRYASCEAIVADIESRSATPGRTDHRRWVLPIAVSALIASAALSIGWFGLGTELGSEIIGDMSDPITVAVSPFRDLTTAGQSRAVGEGLASDLMTRLGGLEGLRLIRTRETEPARMSAYGDSLKADYFLGGDIQGEPGALRVYVSLVDVSSGAQDWGGSFELLAGQPLDVQQEIAVTVIEALPLRFSAMELAQLAGGSKIVAAQDAYLKGLSHVLRRTPSDLAAATEFFREATRLDLSFADAWSGFAHARMLQAGTAYSPERGSGAYEDARAAAFIALDLDPNQALALTTLASIYAEFDWEPARADSAFQVALAMNPNSAEARHLYSLLLAESERMDEAMAQQRRAALLDPESLIHATNLGLIQIYRGENVEALRTFDNVIERDPTFYLAHLHKATLYMVMGRPEDALLAISTAERLVGSPPVVRAIRASALALSGDTAGAEDILGSMTAEAETTYVSPPLFAQVYLALSDTARALDYLELGLRERDVYMTVIKPWPFVSVLRENGRFKRILRAMEGKDP